jgi:hypothetical protein
MSEDIEIAIDTAIEQFKQAAICYGMEKATKSALGYYCDPKPFEQRMQAKEAALKELVYNNSNDKT